MPKPRTRKRWEHPTYKYAYVVERYGNCYTIIDGGEKVAIKGLLWDNKNKSQAIRVLDDRLREKHNPIVEEVKSNIPTTVYDAFEVFTDLKFPSMRALTRKRFLNAMKKYLPNDVALTDKIAIQKQIVEEQEKSQHTHNYKRKIIQNIWKFFEFCVESDFIVKNPIVRDMRLSEKKIDIIIPTKAEVNLILDYFYQHHTKELGDFFKFLSMTGLRSMEALNLWWDTDHTPYIPNSTLKSIVSIDNDFMRIDGKRSKYDEPKIREFPISIIPGLKDLLLSIQQSTVNGKLFVWSALPHLQEKLQDTRHILKLNDKYNMRSLRRYATNWWEKELGIPKNICEYLAGHTDEVRGKYYNKMPSALELKTMFNLSESRPIHTLQKPTINYTLLQQN